MARPRGGGGGRSGSRRGEAAREAQARGAGGRGAGARGTSARQPARGGGGSGGAAAKGAARAAAGAVRASTTRLLPAELRWTCPPLTPSGRAPTAAFLLGQDRPIQALRTGLSIHAPGYNLFVSGLMGSGRSTVVEFLLRDIQPVCRRGPDRVLVQNVRDPSRPVLVSLPPGRGNAFRDELQDLGRGLRAALQAALRSRPHRMSRRVLLRTSEARERRIMDALQRQAQKLDCALVRFQAQSGASTADIYPVVDKEPVTLDALSALAIEGKVDEATRTRLLQSRDQLLERLEEVNDRVRDERHRVETELREMDRRLAFRVLDGHARGFRQRWPQVEVADWLDAVGEHIERHLRGWIDDAGDADDDGAADAAEAMPHDEVLPEFVARVVKTSLDESCPIEFENNPTYANLFGCILPLREGQLSGPTQVSPGALLRADGGYLVLRCLDVLREPGVWPALKRALQTGNVEIRETESPGGMAGGALLPAAIPIDLKVVLIGEPGVYEQLANEDPQFPQIFKIHAEFDTTIPVDDENLGRYADYLHWLASKEGLEPFGPGAYAAVAEYGARAAGRRDRLSTRYSELGDLAREASHLVSQQGGGTVDRAHVEAAVQRQRYRHDLQQELVERDYASGYMRLWTSGTADGQVNALTVLDTGTLAFGRPCRITCNSGAAIATRAGLVNIEGLANLSGPIHDKGVMILEGYLLREFGGEGPLCLQATICFEQLYNGVEGDSASLAQLMALLSSLSMVPFEQGLAVTGSIDQKGEVQAVGAINEKIEGFYRLCTARRLTGTQGVVIPRANVGDLMLDGEVVDAVRKGVFHVHAVQTLGEALQLMSGIPTSDLLDRVRDRLRKFRSLAVILASP